MAAKKLKLTEHYPSEHQEQAAVVDWSNNWAVQKKYPEVMMLFAIPNGGYELAGSAKARAMVSNKLKAEGLRPGFPDLCLPVGRRGYHALFIEMKSRNPKAVTSPEQTTWIARLLGYGNYAIVCHGASTAIGCIEWYLGEEKP